MTAVGSDELDITDSRAVDDFVSPDSVLINCAAYTAVDAAETDQEAARASTRSDRGISRKPVRGWVRG